MLKDEELRMEIVQSHHDILVAEHGGRWKMTELVTRNYWQPEVIRNVGKYMEGCDACQRIKNKTEAPVGNLMTNEILEKMWMYLTVDFITKLPLVAGKNAILVVYDKLSKMAYFVEKIERTLAEGLVRLFMDNVQKLYGLPESVISDRGPQFAVELIKELNKMLGIETRLSTVFHPQMNQELEQYLRFFIEYRQRDWLEWLVTVEFAVNNKIHTATKISPFIANYGRELQMRVDIRRKKKVENMTEFVERMRRV